MASWAELHFRVIADRTRFSTIRAAINPDRDLLDSRRIKSVRVLIGFEQIRGARAYADRTV
jgi:hypothetical protein